MRLANLTLLIMLLLGTACQKERPASPQGQRKVAAPAEVTKIKVDQAGEAYLNTKHVTLEELKQELARLKGAKGGVSYYLEDPSKPQAKVIERVILDAGLPIKITREKFE